MRLDIRYRTLFVYDHLIRESQNELRACPVTDPRQQLLAYRVTVSPSARTLAYSDYWGTRVDHFGVRHPHTAMEVIAEAAVETAPYQPISSDASTRQAAEPEFLDLHSEYLEPTAHTEWGSEVAREASRIVEREGPDLIGVVMGVHRLVGDRLVYAPGSTHIGIEIEDVLGQGSGVCQDYAHLAVAMCRAVGLPARYVSGYLFAADDSTGEDSDADVVRVQTHAWFEAAVPGLGWLPLDPTNRQEVGPRHVKIGHGRDYDDVPPLRGLYSGPGEPTVEAHVDMTRMDVTHQPVTTMQPPTPRAVEATVRQEQQQQQQ